MKVYIVHRNFYEPLKVHSNEVKRETNDFYYLTERELAFGCAARIPKDGACLTPEAAIDAKEMQIYDELCALDKKRAELKRDLDAMSELWCSAAAEKATLPPCSETSDLEC